MTSSNDVPNRPPLWTHDRDHFFKYVTRSTANSILQSCTLRWSSPRYFNDPFDNQFDLHVDVNLEDVREEILSTLWDVFYTDTSVADGNLFGAVISATRGVFPQLSREEFNREFGEVLEESFARLPEITARMQSEIRSVMADSKILCLSEMHDNILMWSHYSENHKGVVLKFRCVPELDSAWGAARPVNYVSQMPRLFDRQFAIRLNAGKASIDVRETMDKLVLSKAIDWAYEKEWRIYGGRGRSQALVEDLPFHPTELEAIIFGCQIPDDDRISLMGLVREKYSHAEMIQARKDGPEFRLIFGPV